MGKRLKELTNYQEKNVGFLMKAKNPMGTHLKALLYVMMHDGRNCGSFKIATSTLTYISRMMI